ncbi:MAG: hypothetical protein AB8E82_11070 [Aureispira sp.]
MAITYTIIKERKKKLPKFVEEGKNLLVELAQSAEYETPEHLYYQSKHLTAFLEELDAMLAEEWLDDTAREWLSPRLGYAIGQYFRLQYKGEWGVNERPDSPQYGHYVVFVPSSQQATTVYPVDPFEAAYEYVHQDPDRDLLSLLEEIEGMLL